MSVRDEAYLDYLDGMKYKDIAAKHGISENTVKTWAARHWKNKSYAIEIIKNQENATETSATEIVATKPEKEKPKKVGAPYGNKNAVGSKGGNGAPRGNKNAFKHGGYSAVYWDTISDDERLMIENMPIEPEMQLSELLKLLTIRERRVMMAINKCAKHDVYVESVHYSEQKKKFSSEEDEEKYNEIRESKIEDGKISYLYDEYTVDTDTKSVSGKIERLEAELTKIQAQKLNCIKLLTQIGKDTQDKDVIDVTPEETINIYLPDNRRD